MMGVNLTGAQAKGTIFLEAGHEPRGFARSDIPRKRFCGQMFAASSSR